MIIALLVRLNLFIYQKLDFKYDLLSDQIICLYPLKVNPFY